MLFSKEPRDASFLEMNESLLEDDDDDEDEDEDEDEEDDEDVGADSAFMPKELNDQSEIDEDDESLLEEGDGAAPSCHPDCPKLFSARKVNTWWETKKRMKAPKCAWMMCSTCKECSSPPSTCIPWCYRAKSNGFTTNLACKNTENFAGCKDCDFCGGTISTALPPNGSEPAPTTAPATTAAPPAPTTAPATPTTEPAPAGPATTPAPTSAPAPAPEPLGPEPKPAPTPAPAPAPPAPTQGKCIATCQTYSTDTYNVGTSCDHVFSKNGCPYKVRSGKGWATKTTWPREASLEEDQGGGSAIVGIGA